MQKNLLTTAILILGLMTGLCAHANGESDALANFNRYIKAANTYNTSIEKMYSPNAKIIRQVVKPNGQLVNVYTNMSTYLKQMKLSQNVAKMRHYTNSYSNVSVSKASNGYKVSALRQPKGESYRLQTYQIWQEQPNGQWKIVEEMMQTKEQILLKYAK